MKQKGFTLGELIIIVIVLGILISFGIPAYQKTVREAQDQEAKATLLLIAAAEKVKVETSGRGVGCNWRGRDNDDCNAKLGLDISSKNWWYGATCDVRWACAEARAQDPRVGTGDWHIRFGYTAPRKCNCWMQNCTR